MAEIVLTPGQRAAVESRGCALLVAAAAGSGKTRVLIDRVLDQVIREGRRVDEFLLITFTQAAAAELRGKLLAELNRRLAADPENRHLQRQLSRVYLAQISTVHSFCAALLRDYAHVLELPADFRLADEQEAAALRERAVRAVLEEAYADPSPAVRAALDLPGAGRDDRALQELIVRVYTNLQCYPDPAATADRWAAMLDVTACTDPGQTIWGEWLLRELQRAARGTQPDSDAPDSPVPTMGGLCLMVGTLAAVGVGWLAACAAQPSLLGSDRQMTSRLLIALLGSLAFGAVGLADDLARIRSRYPNGFGLGLRRTQRLALECIAAALVLGLLALNGCLPTGLILPGAGYVECALAPLLWAVLLVAMAEAARVADGADGTVCGAAFVAMLGLMMLETQLGWFPLAVFPAALAGALMAFLLWDFPPAKLHPGRCGCLYAAGAIGCIPLCIGYAELSIPLALPFWVEGGMVLLQVLFCRWKGRPLFAAAPLHRWLEKRGMSAVNIFYSLCALSVCGLALAVCLARWA